MLQQILYLIPWLIIAAILLIPLACLFLYRRRKIRTCLIFSHLWCMIAFCVLGLFLSHTIRHYREREEYSYKARKLLEVAKILRVGDTQETIMRLDDFLAGMLHQTAYDIPDEKMAELDPDTLSVWQEMKEYYDTYQVEEPGYSGVIPRVRNKLAHVPWSDMQLAIKKFEQTYGSGQRALAPPVKMRAWLGEGLTDDDLKNKVILLDFWNIQCAPCIASLPDLQQIHDTYKDRGLVIITCAGGDNKKTKEFLDKHGYRFPAGMTSHQMFLDYAVRGNPSYFMIDREGYLAWEPEHRLPTADELSNLLEETLNPEKTGEQ
jgi:thiol-disulfide isomerase/thioredoxin